MLFSVRTSLPVVVLGWLLAAGAAPAATPGVEDGAGFFSAEAVQKAQDQIKEIKSRFNKDVRIETFKTVPADRQAGQNLQDEGTRRQLFKNWVNDRIKETQLHGVLVLITRSPGHVEVGVSEDTLKKGFPAEDRDKLGKLLLDKFKDEKFDEGLLDGVRLVQDTLARNLPAQLPSPVVNVVKDYGGFFMPEAVQKADAELKEINSRTKKNIIIETFKKAPTNDVQRLEAMTAQQRNGYYTNWMKNRVQGIRFCVYVLITREPGHVQVAVGPEGEGGAFTLSNRGDLEEILLTGFQKKEFDQALAKAADYIRKTLYAHLNIATTPPKPITTGRVPAETARATARADSVSVPEIASATKKAVPATNPETQRAASGVGAAGGGNEPPASKGGFNPMWILWIVLGLLGLWILYGIFRGLMHRPQVGPAGGYPAPGQAYGTAPGQQVGSHYAAGQPVPPGAPGYAPGYGAGQPMGGYGAGMPYGGGGGGRGGGFLTGMLGGLFGAAAGSWVYDSFFRGPHSQPIGGGFGSPAYGGEPHQYGNAPPSGGSNVGPAAGAAAGGFSSSGGDFDASSGQPVETSGGDFDAGGNQGDTGAGGDFGEAANTADTGAGGDFGADENTGSGGDFGGDAGADSGGGGDFGGNDTSGGDFGGDAGGGDLGGGDAGGDFGGGGGDAGGDGGGGDF